MCTFMQKLSTCYFLGKADFNIKHIEQTKEADNILLFFKSSSKLTTKERMKLVHGILRGLRALFYGK